MTDGKNQTETPSLFCFGLGYSACALTKALMQDGWRVAGTCRSPEKAAALQEQGIGAMVWDGGTSDKAAKAVSVAVSEALSAASHILVSIPPSESGDPVLPVFADAISTHNHLHWLGYLSTTSVYGDHQGEWIDETCPLNPANDRGARRVAAENSWRELSQAHDLPLHIFRLAGIYGPGKTTVDRLRAGTARQIVKQGQVFSRIHVEDLASVLAASMASPHQNDRSCAIYNVADDEPAGPDELIRWAANAMGIEAPPPEPFETAGLSDMARSFYGECKRISNARIKDELGVALKYPTYREGLGSQIS